MRFSELQKRGKQLLVLKPQTLLHSGKRLLAYTLEGQGLRHRNLKPVKDKPPLNRATCTSLCSCAGTRVCAVESENRIKDMTLAKTKWKFLRVHQNQTNLQTNSCVPAQTLAQEQAREQPQEATVACASFKHLQNCGEHKGFSSFPM